MDYVTTVNLLRVIWCNPTEELRKYSVIFFVARKEITTFAFS